MKKKFFTRTRVFSFAVPACMDGMIGLAQTALPLVAIRFGASALFLGTLGWAAQAVRLPCTIGSGLLSEKIGRTRTIIPAAVLGSLACAGFAIARNNHQLLIFYMMMSAAIGLFYPALQAFIGEHSPKGELRKNLSWFNSGWTIGGAVCALSAGFLLTLAKPLPFALASLAAFCTIPLIVIWSRTKVSPAVQVVDDPMSAPASDGPGPLLFIARMGHFLGFFGFAMWRLQFPRLAKFGLHMDEKTIGLLVGILIVGQATGIFIGNAGPWWRGKLWPQLLAQTMLVVAGVTVFFVRSPLLFGLAFLVQGSGLGIAYTGALYYGLQARTNMGRNTGLHEALVASGNITGSFIGGATAQYLSPRAPYITYAIICAVAIMVSLVWWMLNKPKSK